MGSIDRTPSGVQGSVPGCWKLLVLLAGWFLPDGQLEHPSLRKSQTYCVKDRKPGIENPPHSTPIRESGEDLPHIMSLLPYQPPQDAHIQTGSEAEGPQLRGCLSKHPRCPPYPLHPLTQILAQTQTPGSKAAPRALPAGVGAALAAWTRISLRLWGGLVEGWGWDQRTDGVGVRLPLCRSSSLACLEGRGSNSSVKGEQVRFRGSLWGWQGESCEEPRV